jgi:hypothetical protein
MVVRYIALLLLYDASTYRLHSMELPQQFSDYQSCSDYIQWIAPTVDESSAKNKLDLVSATCLRVSFEPPV